MAYTHEFDIAAAHTITTSHFIPCCNKFSCTFFSSYLLLNFINKKILHYMQHRLNEEKKIKLLNKMKKTTQKVNLKK